MQDAKTIVDWLLTLLDADHDLRCATRQQLRQRREDHATAVAGLTQALAIQVNCWAVFWSTDRGETDHYHILESEAEALAKYEEVSAADDTYCAGYAPIKMSTEHWHGSQT